jgi:small subunit ribosomal protein S20
MPQSKSAAKRLRQDEIRRQQNRSVKSALKTSNRSFLDQINGGDKDNATIELNKVYSSLDKATVSGVIKKNTAARKKSQLARKLNSI